MTTVADVELTHLSYSSISAYLACPRAWRYKYIDKVPTPPTPELAFGKAFHDTLETYVTTRFTPGATRKNLTDLWLDRWQRQATEGGVEWDTDTPETYANLGLKMFGHGETVDVVNALAPAIDANGPRIERKIELQVPGVPLPIIGYIDMVASDGTPADFKTSARAWTADKAQDETQSLFYLAALNQASDNSHGWQFRHVVFVKTKTPQAQVFTHRHAPGEVFWLFDLIRSVWRGIAAEVFYPNPTGWKCSPRFCDSFADCRGKYSVGN